MAFRSRDSELPDREGYTQRGSERNGVRISDFTADINGSRRCRMIAIGLAGRGPPASDMRVESARMAESVRVPSRGAILFHSCVTREPDPARAARLYEGLGSAHAATGRGAEAAAAYLRAAERAGSDEAASGLRRQAAEQWIRSGNVREGVRVLDSLGVEFDIRYTDSVVLALFSILWSRFLLKARG
jgi:hypothetical protein